MPLLAGMAKADTQSNDVFRPGRLHKLIAAGAGFYYTYGECEKIQTVKYVNKDSSKQLLWEKSEAAVGEFKLLPA